MAVKKCYLRVRRNDVMKRCYLRKNNTNKALILDDLTGKYTFTINPTPSNATVRLYALGSEQVGNSISVAKDTSVRYKVYKDDFRTVENTVSITNDLTLNVELEEILYKMDTEGYEYYYNPNNKNLSVSKYTGISTDIISPYLEEEDE